MNSLDDFFNSLVALTSLRVTWEVKYMARFDEYLKEYFLLPLNCKFFEFFAGKKGGDWSFATLASFLNESFP